MSNILVTGGNDFIGSNLVDKLAISGRHKVVSLDLYPCLYEPLSKEVTYIQGDYSNVTFMKQIIIDRGINIVYHVAWTSIPETSIEDPLADMERNLLPTVRLLEACRQGGIERFIFISSGGTVYGIPQTIPIKENHPTDPINAYGITKLAVEKYLQMYYHLYGLEYVIFRPSVPYGPRQNPLRRQGAVAVFIYKALRGETITIWGDGESLRDYFYIDDMSRALVTAINRPAKANTIFNLAGAQGYTLSQLVSIIEETLKVDIEVKYQVARKFDVQRLRLDTGMAMKILNWQPEITLTEGIQKTAEWMKKWIH